MCGIAGSVGSQSVLDREFPLDIRHMLERIEHRGPNDSGIWRNEEGSVTLGHRRLSIVDLSDAGHQPMHSASDRFVIVFNGEIYNHRELRRLLESQNASPVKGWKGHSDTETLLACIQCWGLHSTLKNLVGMYAFALWDKHEKSLVLARDRIGEKPLYYGWSGGMFLFASELKALRAHSAFSDEIDWSVADTFLRMNYIPAPLSIYKDTYKLMPGTLLKLSWHDLQRGVLPEPETYWSLEQAAFEGQQAPFSGDFGEAVDELELLIRRAVDMQSIADVPVGAFLSGGIDSSTVVAMMQAGGMSDVTTFSIGMPDEKMDESEHASAVARHLGTKHVEHTIQPHEAINIIPKLTQIWDEPFGDSSQIPTYLVSKLAKEHVTVALSGDGGDEFFLGYPQYDLYQKLSRTRFLRHLPWVMIEAMAEPLSFLPAIGRAMSRARTVVDAWKQSDGQALNNYWHDNYRSQCSPISNTPGVPIRHIPVMSDMVNAAALADAGCYLPDDILVKVDRASMANSLETRAPLLDHRIIEFACRLPTKYKLGAGIGKRVLREVLYRQVPRNIVDRPKMGFSIPLNSWLKDELRPWVESALSVVDEYDEVFDKQMIYSIWQQHLSGERVHTDKLWSMLSLLSFLETKH